MASGWRIRKYLHHGSNLPVGNHTVSFSTISGWTTPSNQTVTLTSNSTATTTTGIYVPILHTNLAQTTNILSLQTATTMNVAPMATIQMPMETNAG